MQTSGRRTYTAKTMAEAMIAMKSELGSQAYLISHRKVQRGGIFGIGAKEFVEVVGERLPDWMNHGGSKQKSFPRKSSGNRQIADPMFTDSPIARRVVDKDHAMLHGNGANGVYGATGKRKASAQIVPSAFDRSIEQSRRPGEAVRSQRSERIPRQARDERNTASEHSAELAEIKIAMVEEFKREIRDLLKKPDAEADQSFSEKAGAACAASPSMADQSAGYGMRGASFELRSPSLDHTAAMGGGIFQLLHDQMADSGIPAALVAEIIGKVSARTAASDVGDFAVIRSRVVKEIASMMKIAPALDPNPDAPMIIVCVGATGVGKTTTLAKLGSLFFEDEARSIAYITLDNYRIAAVEQLRTYSDIQGVPFEEARTAEELADAIDRHIDKDVILIDTPGRSPHHKEAIDELRSILQNLSIDTELLLLVSSTTDIAEMETVIKNFAISDRLRLVFTKVDETLRWGPIFGAAVRSQIPIAFWTTGQNVPNDIEPADPFRFAESLLAFQAADAGSPRVARL